MSGLICISTSRAQVLPWIHSCYQQLSLLFLMTTCKTIKNYGFDWGRKFYTLDLLIFPNQSWRHNPHSKTSAPLELQRKMGHSISCLFNWKLTWLVSECTLVSELVTDSSQSLMPLDQRTGASMQASSSLGNSKQTVKPFIMFFVNQDALNSTQLTQTADWPLAQLLSIPDVTLSETMS